MPDAGDNASITPKELAPAAQLIAKGEWKKAVQVVAQVVATALAVPVAGVAAPVVGAIVRGGVEFFIELSAKSAENRVEEEGQRLDTAQEGSVAKIATRQAFPGRCPPLRCQRIELVSV